MKHICTKLNTRMNLISPAADRYKLFWCLILWIMFVKTIKMIYNFTGHLSALSNFRYVAKKKIAVNDVKRLLLNIKDISKAA